MTTDYTNNVPPLTTVGNQLTPTSNVATGNTLTPAAITVTPNAPPTDALPDNYNPFQHLKEVYYPQHNAAVALFFRDLGTDWKPNIATARSSLRVACTITPDDNELLIAMRHRLFWDLLGYGNSNLVVYNGSTNDIAPPVEGHPKVYFYFSQDIATVAHGTARLDAEYSFRLMKETASTITKAKLTTLATLVKEFFVVGGTGIQFHKGKNIYRYADPVNGYRLMIYAATEGDALPIIEKMLECQEIAYDSNKLSTHEPLKDNTVVPPQQLVYEKEIVPPKFRPSNEVRFRYAYVEIPLVKKPIYLIDTTGRRTALVH